MRAEPTADRWIETAAWIVPTRGPTDGRKQAVPIFDYKGQDARALIAEAQDLATHANNGIPAGWRVLTAQDLGVSADHVDSKGFFRGEGLLEAQATIMAKVDSSGVVRLCVCFEPTNGADAPDYEAMADDSYALAFDYLLEAVKAYGQARGLGGEDVIVTGYSLGAGAANTMAAHKDDSWGGYYSQSDYLAFAVPKLTEIASVFNFGFENDVVHRITGEGDADANAASPLHGVQGNDRAYATSTDNIVLFNATYANPLFPAAGWTLGNLPEGWSAHLDGARFNPIRLIGGSHFYDFMERDSAIVIAHLPPELRQTVWVSDAQRSTSSHFGELAFILGSETGDLLGDGRSDDFLDGFGGDDRFRLSGGNDSVHGGAGTDTVVIGGKLADYTAIRLADGTVYLHDRTGANGLESLASVEQLATDGLLPTTYRISASGIDADGLGTVDLAWSAHREGGAGNDILSAAGRLFGLDGDDRLNGRAGDDLLNGGAGRDILDGAGGVNWMFGEAGDDMLKAGVGDDHLSGGVGSDQFEFRRGLVGDDVITDFNAGEQGHDRILFNKAEFSSFQYVLDHSRQVGDDLVIDGANGSLTLLGTTAADLTASDFFFG
jgi:hypothetical protein